MRQSIKILLLFILTLILTSCWNNRDLTELAIVTGVAVDKLGDGQFEVTVQIVKPGELRSSGEGGSVGGKAYMNISSTGETMFDAVRNLLSKLNKKAFWAHVQLMVISDEVAKEGLSNYFDFFERDSETRRRAYIIITQGITAKTVLESESRLAKLPTSHNVEALEASDAFGKSFKINLLEVLKVFDEKEYCPTLPILYNSKPSGTIYQEDLIMEGSAVIKKDKLIGFLDTLQTRGFLFANDKIKSTIIVIPSPINQNKKVSIEIIHSKGTVDAVIEDGKPLLSIEIKAEGNIGEQQEKDDLTKEGTVKDIETQVQKEIKKEIQDAIKLSQEKYHADIFGFIKKIRQNYYSEWEELVTDWSEIYSNTPIKVNVDFKLRTPGLIKNATNPK